MAASGRETSLPAEMRDEMTYQTTLQTKDEMRDEMTYQTKDEITYQETLQTRNEMRDETIYQMTYQTKDEMREVVVRKKLIFRLRRGDIIKATLEVDRKDCRPKLHEGHYYDISNIHLYIEEKKLHTIITMEPHPKPIVYMVDKDEASFLLSAELVSVDGIEIPEFVNKGRAHEETYIYGSYLEDKIVVCRNSLDLGYCSALYLHMILTRFCSRDIHEDSSFCDIWNLREYAREKILQLDGSKSTPYNSCLYRYYKSGDYSESEIPSEALNGNLWSIYLGGSCNIMFTKNEDAGYSTIDYSSVKLYHGDIVKMIGPDIQCQWKYATIQQSYQPYISLTFLQMESPLL